MINYETNNKVVVGGEITSEPKFSHEIYGENFYEFDLKINRLSDSFDIIPITISDRLINGKELKIGDKIEGVGQYRSYNKLEGEKSRLMLTIFLREFEKVEDIEEKNNIEIVGFVCKEPIYRTTPFNREICDVLLAVNRNYGKSDYIPCIAWGRNARFVKDFKVGDKVKVEGRIQSREYQKKLENEEVQTKVAYEVSLSKISLIKEKCIEERNEEAPNIISAETVKGVYAI